MSGMKPLGFWGLVVEPGKMYSQEVPVSFKITMATLGMEAFAEGGNKGRTMVMLTHQKDGEFALCSLTPEKHEQQALDVVFAEGETIHLRVVGENAIHLTGYYVNEEERGNGMDGYDSEELDAEMNGEDIGDSEDECCDHDHGDSDDDEMDSDMDSFLDDEDISGEEDEDDSGEDSDEESEVEIRKSNGKGKKSHSRIREITEDDEDSEEDSDYNSDEEEEEEEDSNEDSDDESEDEADSDDYDTDESVEIDSEGEEEMGSEEIDSDEAGSIDLETISKMDLGQKRSSSGKKDKKEVVVEAKKIKIEEPLKKNKKQQQSETSPVVAVKPVVVKPVAKDSPVKKNTTETSKSSSPSTATTEVENKNPNQVATPISKTLPSGIHVEDVKPGAGIKAQRGRHVEITYTVSNDTGKTISSQQTLSFKVGDDKILKALSTGLQGMALGGERKMVIPGSMVEEGSQPSLPKNSNYTITVKLDKVLPKQQ